MGEKRCDVCGKPAKHEVVDTFAELPEHGEFINFYISRRSFFCDDHDRKGKVKTLNPQVGEFLENTGDDVEVINEQ